MIVFKWCNNLKSIIIPESVVEIGSNAIPTWTTIRCKKDSTGETWAKSNGNEIEYLDDDPVIVTVREGIFGLDGSNLQWKLSDEGILTISGSGEMESFYATDTPWGKEIIEVVVEDGVTSIGCGAFSDCEKLTYITLADSITAIDSYAFYNCESLTEIVIPTDVTIIEGDVFHNCLNLDRKSVV